MVSFLPNSRVRISDKNGYYKDNFDVVRIQSSFRVYAVPDHISIEHRTPAIVEEKQETSHLSAGGFLCGLAVGWTRL
jgi:hypothetical protein